MVEKWRTDAQPVSAESPLAIDEYINEFSAVCPNSPAALIK
jgi:hypothetical protein